jgi:SAM-dependent methyltransferase
MTLQGQPPVVPPALSGTHSHLLAVIARELRRRCAPGAVVRILDVGCGDGRLLEYLATALPLVLEGREVELYGFDVAGHATQPADVLDGALERLSAAHPGTNWQDRLHLIREGDAWPFAPAFFDGILSNQVLEHVADADLFFAELARTLRPGGVSAHLFPSHHVVMEPHLHTPFVHWFGNVDLMQRWLALWARTGRSAYGRWQGSQPQGTGTLDRYARVHADFLQRFTHYRTQGQLLSLVKQAGMHGSFSSSPGYVATALARRFRGAAASVAPAPPPFRSAMLTLVLRYLTSLTLVTSRDADYTAALSEKPAP